MRYAILSDIHSNLEALTAVWEALAGESIDGSLCLGDIVGYGADPTAVLAKIEASPMTAVGGNHDLACIGRFDPHGLNRAAEAAVLWTRDRLSFAELDWLRRLPLTATEGPCTLVHGSLRRPERFEYLMELAQMIDTLSVCRTPLCLAGHTHVPCFVEYDRAARRIIRVLTTEAELAEVAVPLEDERRCLFNPGSVGQPRDGDPRASVAILDTDARRLWLRRIPYDMEAAAGKIRRAGLPGFLADRLLVGR